MARISAKSARNHTRKKQPPKFVLPAGPWLALFPVLIISALAPLIYNVIQPPPPVVVGTPGGPPITAKRIQLKDGRHLAYNEGGFPKEGAKFKAITLHGISRGRHDLYPASKEVLQKLGVHLVGFDRPGYGQSDPHPGRNAKSIASDVEQLADAIELGQKFYLISTSMGGVTAWSCLKYIQHRIAGVAMEAPVINFWWDGFPPEVFNAGFGTQYAEDRWGLRVAHYAPWLTYWWLTQKFFPPLSASPGSKTMHLCKADMEIIKLIRKNQELEHGSDHQAKSEAQLQGVSESIHRDILVSFGKWSFSPLDLHNPYIPVHVWQGDEDYLVPVVMQRYLAKELPWIEYHELTGHGHILSRVPGLADEIVTTLFTDKMQDRIVDGF
eukprot:TRINITY_DN2169_c0_g1_i1.p1 TRINITY_DN2169_c0_g1~~TRINITY_DN2169_c0_g1_i1.p1  ORF type:complete len:382 (+),score=49.57 TRINITY_DN2169_c0_g1_i1:44-1189(+)